MADVPGARLLVVSDTHLAAKTPEALANWDAVTRYVSAAASRWSSAGHVHQFRVLQTGRSRHVWAPTTWAVLPEAAQPTMGVKQCGVLCLELGGDDELDAELTTPPGMLQLTLLEDIPDPYAHSAPPRRFAATGGVHRGISQTGAVPYIVDPRPWLKAELAAKRAELEAATEEADRSRLQAEVDELEGELRPRFFRWRRRHPHW